MYVHLAGKICQVTPRPCEGFTRYALTVSIAKIDLGKIPFHLILRIVNLALTLFAIEYLYLLLLSAEMSTVLIFQVQHFSNTVFRNNKNQTKK